MGCYLMVTNRLFLGETGKLSMEKGKRKCSKGIFKIVEELEIAKYRITFSHFPYICFI